MHREDYFKEIAQRKKGILDHKKNKGEQWLLEMNVKSDEGNNAELLGLNMYLEDVMIYTIYLEATLLKLIVSIKTKLTW